MEKQTTFTYILLWHQNTICEQDFKDSNVFLHVTLTLLILVKLSLTNFEFVNATTYIYFFENFDILTYTVNKWLRAHFSNRSIFELYPMCSCEGLGLVKVQILWEGHKNFALLPIFIWHYLVASNYKWKMGQIFWAFSEYPNFNTN